MKKKRPIFKFQKFSKKQRQIFTWWLPNSPVREAGGIIADGAIRSGKTVSMSLSYTMWSMANYDGQNFIMAGKTISSFKRNVLQNLKLMLTSRGYHWIYHISGDFPNMLEVSRNGRTNYFYIFGGKDEGSQDLVQGITAAGAFFDEVALMPESFVNQATARCSVEGATWWFNCNPSGPMHWFKLEWIDKRIKKRLLYLHFTMDDNLSLSEKVKEKYRAMYDPYIDGRGISQPAFIEHMEDYGLSPVIQKMVLSTRDVVPNILHYVTDCKKDVEKVNVYLADVKDIELLRKELSGVEGIVISSSLYNNLEINALGATKGIALMWLAGYLGIAPEATMAFGDGENDLSMLEAAGVGIAMGNGLDIAKNAADQITLTNDEDGAADAIERLIFN